MASLIQWRDVLAIVLLIASINCVVFGLPIQVRDGEYTGYQPPDETYPQPDGQPMFPDNMPPPPPGAMNDGWADEVPQKFARLPPAGDQLLPSNYPVPPMGTDTDSGTGFDPASVPVPPQNGDGGTPMFPDNIPPPPPGAFNDGVPPQEEVVPPYGRQMFPPNMPAPPPGAMNDGGVSETFSLSEIKDIPPPPLNKGQMFPSNMPPPPPGALNDGGAPPQYIPIKTSQSQYPSGSTDNIGSKVAPLSKLPVPTSRDMFPPNMPPPPPGAFNEPPPGPFLVPQKPTSPFEPTGKRDSNAPANPPSGAVMEQVYVSGDNIPARASPPADGQSPSHDPYQTVADSKTIQYVSNSQPTNANHDDAIANMYPDTGAGAASQAAEPAPYDPDAIVAPPPDSGVSPSEEQAYFVPGNGGERDETTDSGMKQSKSESWDFPNESEAWDDEDLSEGRDETEKSFSEDSYSPDEDFSWGGYFSHMSSDSGSDYAENKEALPLDSYEGDKNTDYTNGFNLFSGSSSETGEAEWDIDEDGDDEWDSFLSEEDDEFDREEQERIKEQMEEEMEDFLKEKYMNEFTPDGGRDMVQPAGTTLVLYSIPAIILTVLILLAWRNYRGRIRVVSVSSVDTNQFNWRPIPKSDEELEPMLDSKDRENY